jgi:hypothetical protein
LAIALAAGAGVVGVVGVALTVVAIKLAAIVDAIKSRFVWFSIIHSSLKSSIGGHLQRFWL